MILAINYQFIPSRTVVWLDRTAFFACVLTGILLGAEFLVVRRFCLVSVLSGLFVFGIWYWTGKLAGEKTAPAVVPTWLVSMSAFLILLVTGLVVIWIGFQIRGAQGPPVEREVSIKDAPISGDPKAKLTLVEFTDYECQFCGRFFQQVLPQLDKDFIQTGELRHIILELPLTIHTNAQKAAEAVQCAGVQGKYWQMHDKLFQNQKTLEVPHLKQYAKESGLDILPFDECLDSGEQAAKVQRDFQEAQRLGVTGTPSFVLGYTTPGETIKGISIEGAQPIELFKQEINRLLTQAAQPANPP